MVGKSVAFFGLVDASYDVQGAPPDPRGRVREELFSRRALSVGHRYAITKEHLESI